MARGGRRPGAGRKPGSVNKRSRVSAKQIADAMAADTTAVAVMQRAMLRLESEEKFLEAATVAARLAPYQTSKVPVMLQPAARHPMQKLQDDLFDPLPSPKGAPDEAQADEFDGLLN